MTCAQALLSLFLLSPCEGGGSGKPAIESAVHNPARPSADVQRDAARKPAEVLAFFGIRPGMTVLDVFAGGGYYSEILDSVVGDAGKVISHNNQAYLDFIGPQLEERFSTGRMTHTEKLISEIDDLKLKSKSLDAVLMVLAYHDFFYGDPQFNWPDPDEAGFLEELCNAMKPGAVLGVVDHVANADDDIIRAAADLHRVAPQKVIADMTASCFDLAAESEILRIPGDDHTKPSIAQEMSGKTDRFVYKFVRR